MSQNGNSNNNSNQPKSNALMNCLCLCYRDSEHVQNNMRRDGGQSVGERYQGIIDSEGNIQNNNAIIAPQQNEIIEDNVLQKNENQDQQQRINKIEEEIPSNIVNEEGQIPRNHTDVAAPQPNEIVEESKLSENEKQEEINDNKNTLDYNFQSLYPQKRNGSNELGKTLMFINNQNLNEEKKKIPTRPSTTQDDVNQSFDTSASSQRKKSLVQKFDAALKQYYWNEELNPNATNKDGSITLTESTIFKMGDRSMISFNHNWSEMHKYVIVADIFIKGEATINEKKNEQLNTEKYRYEDEYLDNENLHIIKISKRNKNDICYFMASVTSKMGPLVNQL